MNTRNPMYTLTMNKVKIDFKDGTSREFGGVFDVKMNGAAITLRFTELPAGEKYQPLDNTAPLSVEAVETTTGIFNVYYLWEDIVEVSIT